MQVAAMLHPSVEFFSETLGMTSFHWQMPRRYFRRQDCGMTRVFHFTGLCTKYEY